MKTKIIYPLSLLLLLCLTQVSCGSDNNDSIDSPKESVIYHLIDKDCKETTVFNHGDLMSFELIITNTTDHTLHFEDESDLINHAFLVYNSEGQSFNPIVSRELIYRKFPVTIAPGEQFRRGLTWPWHLVPLPTGKYYSPYTIDIEGISNRTYTVDFEIR